MLGDTDRKIAKYAVIENAITLIVLGVLYAYTRSAWCFLLLLNLNTVKLLNGDK